MNIAIITSRFVPETSPGAKRATDLALSLQEAGHCTTVLTQLPNYPNPAAFEYDLPPGATRVIEEDGDGNAIWKFAPTIVPKKSLVRRLGAELRFAIRVSRQRTGLSGFDGVVASTPFIFNLIAAQTYGVPLWLDVRDLTWEYASTLVSRSPLRGLGASALRSIALSNLRSAARVSTTTESQRRYLLEQGVREENVIVVPNGVSRGIVDALERRRAESHTTVGARRPLRIVYAGLLGYPQGLEFAIDAVAPLKGVELHLFGEGAHRVQLETLSRERALSHVVFHGHVSHELYLDALAGADVLHASLRNEVQEAMPSKIWEYMAAGKPVLFAGSGEAAGAITQAGAGYAVEYGNVGAFREAIDALRNPNRRRKIGAKGHESVTRHRIREDTNRQWVTQIENAFAQSFSPRSKA